MEQLRERALGEGWRKLVVDGVTATPVLLRRGPAVKIVDGPRTETVPREEWPGRFDALLQPARDVHLLTPDGDVHARRTKKGRWLVSRGKPSSELPATGVHDRERLHALPPDHALFKATKIGRDKERQVQHYVELLRTLLIWERERIRVVDAGCGKAYMSLALVAYGREVGTRVELVGLDTNPQVIETVQRIADELGYDEARFETTSIEAYESTESNDSGPIDLLVSLHACDTATDEAIAAGVRLGAEAIVVAPCCHHELAEQIARRDKDALLRHGLLLGRQADLVTDALRAAALEMLGYRVEVMEFVSAEHTAKNVMLRAQRAPSRTRSARATAEYAQLRDEWGVDPAIGRLLASRLPVAAGRSAVVSPSDGVETTTGG
jgi:SAM-dependent methyltransferase